MIVIADTSPLNYLIQIDCERLLQALYKRVLIPTAVVAELRDPSSPTDVKEWLSNLPEWVEIKTIAAAADPALRVLGPGEREAIQLAQEQNADLLLVDERKGRLEATRRGLATTGTLGVLLAAAERSLVDVEPTFYRLVRKTNFRVTPALQASFLQRIRDRNSGL